MLNSCIILIDIYLTQTHSQQIDYFFFNCKMNVVTFKNETESGRHFYNMQFLGKKINSYNKPLPLYMKSAKNYHLPRLFIIYFESYNNLYRLLITPNC